MRLLKKTEAPEEERIGTWADTGYSATDEQAHRNVVYEGTSSIKRIMWIFVSQMKLFSKNRWTFIMLFAAVLIPVLILGIPELNDLLIQNTAGSTAYIGTVLCFMPVMMSFFTAFLCGTQIPNEFKDRTAYMSIPLPMRRIEFYIGKYLAGFVLCLGVFLMAFGFAVIMAMRHFDAFFSDQIAEALASTVVAIFVFSATSFCVGCFMKRGSALVPMLLMLFVLPMISFAIYAKYDIEEMLLMPCFLPDSIVFTLGGSPFSMAGTFAGLISPDALTANLGGMIGVGVVWGIAFLALGAFRMERREM